MRVFLGSQGPLVSAAASWLVDEFGGELAAATLVVSGRRGGRTLQRHIEMALADRGRSRVAEMPLVIPLGALAETLHGCPAAQTARLGRLLAWTAVLRHSDEERLRGVFPSQPRGDDVAGWWRLAEEVCELQDDLAFEGLAIGDVLPALLSQGGVVDEERWRHLRWFERRYRDWCRCHRFDDPNRLRLRVMREAATSGAGALILVSVFELGRMARTMLAASGRQVVALIGACDDEAGLYDTWGQPNENWKHRHLPLARASLSIVDRPAEQAAEVARRLRQRSSPAPDEKRGAGVAAERGTRRTSVVAPEPRLLPRLQRALEEDGLAANVPIGELARSSPPYRLLESLGRYLTARSFEDFCALVRHPEIGDLLDRQLRTEPGFEPSWGEDRAVREAVEARDWLTVLDRYTTATVQRTLGSQWPGDRLAVAVIQALDRVVSGSLGVGASEDPGLEALGIWSERLLDFLRTVYEGRDFDPLDRQDAVEIGALQLLAAALREQSALDPHHESTPHLSLAQAIELTLLRHGDERLPTARAAADAIELLGWLDAAMDDAEELVIVGLNEGIVPSRMRAGSFLRDSDRRALGMADAESRLRRDMAILSCLLNRRRTTMIAGRRDFDDEPLLPSRLLLATDSQGIATTLLEFHRQNNEVSGASAAPLAIVSGAGFDVRAPETSIVERPRSLAVTAFRDYLRCPYRFYLRHVLRLADSRDLPAELDPGPFGALAHEVLRRFARHADASSGSPQRVTRCLHRLLEVAAEERVGEPPVAVRMQLEQLRRRLQVFAEWQASQVAAGWIIDRTLAERELRTRMVVDGFDFELRGRIDRVDRHPDLGWRVLDYKTAEVARSPEQTHRQTRDRSREWVDLQLPLYELLLRAKGLEGPMELGFVNLAPDLSGSVLASASWSADELRAARTVAEGVVRDVRSGRFWPPGEAAPYDDGLRRLLASVESSSAVGATAIRRPPGEPDARP